MIPCIKDITAELGDEKCVEKVGQNLEHTLLGVISVERLDISSITNLADICRCHNNRGGVVSILDLSTNEIVNCTDYVYYSSTENDPNANILNNKLIFLVGSNTN